MSMHRWGTARRERGQVLIIVAVALVGLLALAGLAIDGGNLLMERRRAQNAADAAALAGTRLISLAMMTCDAIDYSGLDLEIARVVNEYAEGNGISDTNGVPGDEVNDNVVAYYVDISETRLATVGDGEVPMRTSGVEVEVWDQHATYFLQVVGIDTIPSSAQAMAMAGVVRVLPAGSNLIPVGIPEIVLDAVEQDGNPDWEMHDTGDGEFCYYPEGATELVCPIDPESPNSSVRGWLNFNHIFNREYLPADDPDNRTYEQNVSNDPCKDAPALPGLAGWASGLCYDRTPMIIAGTSCYEEDGEGCTVPNLDGDFIHGDPGARAASLMDLYDGYGGKVAYAPVFDRVWLREQMVGFFPDQAESPTVYWEWADGPEWDVDWPNGGGFSSSAGGSGDSWYYHIVGWVSAAIPKDDKENKILYGGFERKAIQTGKIEISELGGTCSLLMHGVTLWR
jgi:hypothetical protein